MSDFHAGATDVLKTCLGRQVADRCPVRVVRQHFGQACRLLVRELNRLAANIGGRSRGSVVATVAVSRNLCRNLGWVILGHLEAALGRRGVPAGIRWGSSRFSRRRCVAGVGGSRRFRSGSSRGSSGRWCVAGVTGIAGISRWCVAGVASFSGRREAIVRPGLARVEVVCRRRERRRGVRERGLRGKRVLVPCLPARGRGHWVIQATPHHVLEPVGRTLTIDRKRVGRRRFSRRSKRLLPVLRSLHSGIIWQPVAVEVVQHTIAVSIARYGYAYHASGVSRCLNWGFSVPFVLARVAALGVFVVATRLGALAALRAVVRATVAAARSEAAATASAAVVCRGSVGSGGRSRAVVGFRVVLGSVGVLVLGVVANLGVGVVAGLGVGSGLLALGVVAGLGVRPRSLAPGSPGAVGL